MEFLSHFGAMLNDDKGDETNDEESDDEEIEMVPEHYETDDEDEE